MTPTERYLLAKAIKDDIERVSVERYSEPLPRTHLGASVIGHPCSRFLQSGFRWFRHEQFSGRMHRLFNRGHEEEARIISFLEAAGFSIKSAEFDGEQVRFADCDNHYGGSLDSQGVLPAHYYDAFRFLEGISGFLLEFKTSNERWFKKLEKNNVNLTYPKHVIQMNTYGKYLGYRYAIYFNVNKNDDDIHVEVLELKDVIAEQATQKANNVIYSRVPLPKISQSPSHEECQYCVMQGICFKGEVPNKNCRSCIYAVPAPNGEWGCEYHNELIPKDFIPQGCGNWVRFG